MYAKQTNSLTKYPVLVHQVPFLQKVLYFKFVPATG